MIDIYVPLMLECLNEHAIYSIFSFKNRYFFYKICCEHQVHAISDLLPILDYY